MIFNSLEFIFLFLFVLVFYFLVPQSKSKYALLVIGLFWYSLWSNSWLLGLLLILTGNYLYLLGGWKFNAFERKIYFPLIVIINILIFISLKFVPVFNEAEVVPYGTSFFMLTLIGCLIDLWRNSKNYKAESFIDFALPNFFFPTLVAGPVERNAYLKQQFSKNLSLNQENVINGLILFSYGFSKLYYLHTILQNIVEFSLVTTQSNILSILTGAVASCILVYVDFSSYSDMGRGIAKFFNVDLTINFRPFFFSKNPNEYWQRWNISLGTWIRDYITMPLMFSIGRTVHYNWILIFSFLLIGFWHGIGWNWVVFGLCNGLLIVLYNNLQARKNRYIKFWGIFLVLLLYLCCGFFQNTESLLILKSLAANNDLVFIFKHTPLKAAIVEAPVFLMYFAFFLAIDVCQEKLGMDFYLKWNIKIKKILVIFIIVLFFVGLKGRRFSTENLFQLPIYFRM